MAPRTLTKDMAPADRKVLTDIRDHGWHVLKVLDEEEPEYGFAFTIGLPTTFQHPELLIVGMRLELMHVLLNNLGAELREGGHFEDGGVHDGLLEGFRCCFRKVSRDWYRDYLGYASWYHRGNDYDVLQVVWPDLENRLPWHPAATKAFRAQQPVLDQPRRR